MREREKETCSQKSALKEEGEKRFDALQKAKTASNKDQRVMKLSRCSQALISNFVHSKELMSFLPVKFARPIANFLLRVTDPLCGFSIHRIGEKPPKPKFFLGRGSQNAIQLIGPLSLGQS